MMTTARSIGASALAGLATMSSAHGAIGDPIFRIDVTTASGSGFYEVDSSELTTFPMFSFWNLASAVQIMDGSGGVLATVASAGVNIADDPTMTPGGTAQIAGNFTVFAGSEDIDVQVSFAEVTIDTIPFATARTSGSFVLTDNSQDSATAAGNFGGDFFRATINGGTVFDTLLSGPVSVTNPGNSTDINDENAPNPTFVPVGGSVSSFQTGFDFSLTAGDSAGGTHNFFVTVPAPASAALLIAGLGIAGRSRR